MNDEFVKRGKVGIGGLNWWHRIHLPEGITEGQCIHGPDDDHSWVTSRFGLPYDLKGKSVIGIGEWDGFFSFKAEERGAKYVLATDTTFDQGGTWGGTAGFKYAHKALKSNVHWRELNIEKNINVDDLYVLGTFDIVTCYGVLYHLKSPLLAVENLMKLVTSGGTVLVETAISNMGYSVPVLEYRPGFEGDPTNYFYPNVAWVEEAFKQNGAKSVEAIYNDTHRATFKVQA